jgi:hypothetical protein
MTATYLRLVTAEEASATKSRPPSLAGLPAAVTVVRARFGQPCLACRRSPREGTPVFWCRGIGITHYKPECSEYWRDPRNLVKPVSVPAPSDPITQQPTPCSRCGTPILWAVTQRGKRIPLDAKMVDDGHYTLQAREDLPPVAIYYRTHPTLGYACHLTTCSNKS